MRRPTASPGTRAAQALYNPLYLHAGVGLGKTHLLHAIGHEARAQGRRVIYLTADRFMYGFVAALKAQTALAFKERLRGIDLLIIDDVQFIQGKLIQQEFGHTLNALIDAGRQIVVAADRPPTDLESLDERVRSRLAGGLVVEVGALDEALRASILAARIATVKTAHPTFDVEPGGRSPTSPARSPPTAAISKAPSTGCSPMRRSPARRSRSRPPRSRSATSSATASRSGSRSRTSRSSSRRRYNVSRSDILSERRTAAVVQPRQIAMYLSKVLTLRSLPEIGRRFGGRDHTTVLHAVRKIEKAARRGHTRSTTRSSS